MSKKKREPELPSLNFKDDVPSVFSWPIKLAGLFFISSGLFLIFWLASRGTYLQFDSFMMINGARKILGWDGVWLNIYWFPIVAYFYSRLLLFSQQFHSFVVELRWACLFNAATIAGAFLLAVVWFKKVFTNRPLMWLFSTAFLSLNYYVVEFAYTPLTDFLGMGLATLGMILALQGIQKDSNLYRILAASIFGLAVPMKYQLWVMAVVAMVCEWMAFHRELPWSERLKKLAPYPICGIVFSCGIQFLMWHQYGSLYQAENRTGVLAIAREFLAYYKTWTTDNERAWWNYFELLGKTIGWPAVVALVWGWFSTCKSQGMMKVTFVWITAYVATLFFYQFMYRYIVHILPPIAVLIAVGIDRLPGISSIHPAIVKGLAATAVLMQSVTIAAQTFYEKNSYQYSSPAWITMGDVIRKDLGPKNNFYQMAGAASWGNYIAQRIPITIYAKDSDVVRGPVRWSLDYLPHFKEGDVILWNSSPGIRDFEFYTAKIGVSDFMRVGSDSARILFANEKNKFLMMQKNDQVWSLNQRPSKWEVWILFFRTNTGETRMILLPEMLVKISMGKISQGQVLGLRKVSLEATYHNLI